jgi:hypothetical protein
MFYFYSCSASWHVKRAIKKDPTIEAPVHDTISFTKVVEDTIYNSDSTYYIERRIVEYDSVIVYQKYDFSKMKTWFETWQENKTERKEIKHDSKVERVVAKQEGKTERNKDKQERKALTDIWMWLFFAMVVFFLGTFVYKKYFKSTEK